MNKHSYTVKYRRAGQWFWRTLRNVWRDEVVYAWVEHRDNGNGTRAVIGHDPLFRSFATVDDAIVFVPMDAEVKFMPDRAAAKLKEMSKETGHPVEMA